VNDFLADMIRTLDNTLNIINNLDVREPLRRFAPQWSIVFVDPSGEIIDVARFKEWPKPPGILPPQMEKHLGTVKFLAQPGMYTTIDQLRKKIINCVWTHNNADRLKNL
jgi:hypothetical protein